MDFIKNKRTIMVAATCIVLGLTVFGIVRYRSSVLAPPVNVMIRESTLSWQKNDKAAGYIVSIDGKEREIQETEYPLHSLIEAKAYTIKVKTLSDGKNNNDSDWSSPVSITRLAPPKLAVCKTKLEWNQIDHNAGYILFHDGVYFADTDKDHTSYDLLKEMSNEEYTVLAKGDGTTSLDSPMSPRSTLKRLDIPGNLRLNGTVFSWDNVPGADYYIVNSGAKNWGTVKEARFDLNDIKPGNYEITVQAITEKENPCDSEKASITVTIEKKPLTLSGVRIQNRMLLWSRLDNADGYKIAIKQKGNIIKTVSILSPLEDTFDLTGLGLKDGAYEIEIAAKGNDYYEDSPLYKVTYTERLTEQKSESAGKNDLGAIQNARIDKGTLKWNALPNARGYIINIENSNNVINDFQINPTQTLELNIPALLLKPGDYKVTLYALGNQNYNNSLKKTLSYTVVKLVAPKNLAYNATVITWGSVDNADKYIVKFGNESPVTVTDTTYTVSSVLPGSYTITVQALSDNPELQNSDQVTIQHTESKWALGSIRNIRVENGVFKWDATPDATGYTAQIKNSSGTTLYTYEKAPTNKLEIDLYAINLLLGSYTITLQALGNFVYSDSAVVDTAYEEKMIRDATVRVNFNYGNKYADNSQYWIQHYINFSLKGGFTFDPINASQTEWNTLYTNFLASGGDTKNTAAQKIGNDVIITYYYLNDQGQPVTLNTTTGLPLVKNKLWDNWLHQYNGNGYTGLQGTPVSGTSIGSIVAGNTWLQVSANIGRRNPAGDSTSVISTQLDTIKGKVLYVDINVIIRDGSNVEYYKETVPLTIRDY